MQKLNTNISGIILIFGIPGSGKTTLSNWLKKSIFLNSEIKKEIFYLEFDSIE